MRLRIPILLLLLGLLTSVSFVRGQIVGTDCFLQGQWLEVGVNRMGGFGTCSSPATYHPHLCCGTGTAFTPGGALDAAYDWGHDGWSVGMPPLMGNYTQPGFPQEGWSVQIGATEYRNGAWGGLCTGATAIAGSITGYSNIAQRATATWTGAVAGMNIRQETVVDTYSSWAVITAHLYNTTATPMTNVHYERTCDPDNISYWSGGSSTRQVIVHQNEDARHLVQISAYGDRAGSGSTPTYDSINSYLGYAARDCRARVGEIGSLAPSSTPSVLWTNSGPAGPTSPVTLSTLGTTANRDRGIFIVFNIGTIAPGDSAVVSYAYIYNGTYGLDSALPNPEMVINGVPRVSYAPPIPNYDTFDVCANPIDTLPIDIRHAEDRSWSWSKWTWAPSTGLSATTGAHVRIVTRELPPVITYTITGKDTSAGLGSCLEKTFYLTIHTCNGAESNEPCVGDTLFFNAPGDSLGATYKWFGPDPSTAVFGTAQTAYIFSATTANRGRYYVAKTQAGLTDTSFTDVIVNEAPVIAVTSNLPDCNPVVDPLNLFAAPDSLCTEFSWVGPGGFTSTLQNPVVSPFDSSLGGVYTVTAVSDDGCVGTGTINIKPGPVPLFDFDRHPACPNDTVFFNDYSQNTATWEWSFGDTKTGYDRNPIHIYTDGHKKYNATVKVTSSNGCTKSLTKEVNLEHTVTANFSVFDDTICNGTGLVITDLSNSTKYVSTPTVPLATYKWEFGDGNDSATWGAPPAYVYEQEGIYVPTLTVTDSLGCVDTKQMNIVVLQPYINSITDSTFCLVQPLKLWNTIYIQPNIEFPGYDEYNYSWSPAANLSSATVKEPFFKAIGNYTYTLTATMAGEGCQAEHVMTLNSILPTPLTQVTRGTKIQYGGSVQLNADSQLYYTWVPNDGSLNNPNINNPIATPTVTTTYTVYGMDKYGCRDTAMITIIVDSSMTEFIPTGFTPNGDGRNDIFRLNGSKFRDLVEMRIYNRWGAQVFYTTTTEQGWDGTLNGVPQDLGVYYYTVILARPGYPDNQVYKGEITLIR